MARERTGWKAALALLVSLAAVIALTACGSSGSGTTGASGATGSRPSPFGAEAGTNEGSGGSTASPGGGPTRNGAGSGNSTSGKTGEGGPGEAGIASNGQSKGRITTRLRVSGGGSAQFRTRGGDNSVQDFGSESGGAELRQAAEALHGFFVARSNEDWAGACSFLSSATAREIQQFAAAGEKGKSKDCAEVLATMTATPSAAVRRELTVVDAVSLRREGGHAFLIYRGEEEGRRKVYAIAMALEGGAWKVSGLAPVALE